MNNPATLDQFAQQPSAYIEEWELEQFEAGTSLWATAYREGGTSGNGQERMPLFAEPSVELAKLRSQVAALEHAEAEALRRAHVAECQRDAMKLQGEKLVELLEVSSHHLHDYGQLDARTHAEKIDSFLGESKKFSVISEPTDSKILAEYLASKIVGKTVSVDVSTGDQDAGNRLFCTVAEVMVEGDGFTILAVDPEPNFQNEINAQQIARVVDFGNKEGWVAQGITLQWCSDIRQQDFVGAKLYANEQEMEMLRLQVGTLKAQNRGLIKKRDKARAHLNELVSAVRSINQGRAYEVKVPGDDEPQYRQRKEWVEWVLELCDQVDPQAGKAAEAESEVKSDA